MDLFEQVEWSNWKKLTDIEKEALLNRLLLYFTPSKLEITTIELVDFELYGIKCRTFELELEGELFVFVPGNAEAILGWDLGAEGLRPHELLGYDSTSLEKSTFKTSLTNEAIHTEIMWDEEDEPYDLTSLEGISTYINEQTTPLRKVAVPAMFVQKYALPAGTDFLGIFDTVSGIFEGDVEQFSPYQEQICEKLFPVLSVSESFQWSFPKTVLEKNQYYLEFLPESDYYFVYRHQEFSHAALKAALKVQGFTLLSEDQWEFAVGGGSRRLFRWGNELVLQDNESSRQIKGKMTGSNMFGLVVDTQRTRYEMTTDPEICKLSCMGYIEDTVIERMLPLSTYYRSNNRHLDEKLMNPDQYSYRKAIIIE